MKTRIPKVALRLSAFITNCLIGRITDPVIRKRTISVATITIARAIGAILRYAINVHSDVINIQTVGLILMIAGGAGLALSLLYELVQQGGTRDDGDEYPQRRSGYDDPTRRM